MKEYKFISREAGISCSIIELFRDNVYEYYVLTPYSSDLYFSFGAPDQFTEHSLYRLFVRGYFDNIIRGAKDDFWRHEAELKKLLEIDI